jgi:hypothetical protein
VNTTDILRTLHGLAAEDRAWIIERLPARAKAQLLAMHPDEKDTPEEEVHLEQPERIPADVDAVRLVAVLADEPLWIAAVVLEGSTEPWVAAVLERLPVGMRADVRSMLSAVRALTSHAKETLIRSVLARVGCGEAEPTRSRFQALLARLSASRSKKRLTIHL